MTDFSSPLQAPSGDRPDALIFDLDGTLWDSTETVALAWNRALERMGKEGRRMTAADIAGIMGLPHRDIYRKLFPGLEEREQEAIVLACYREEEKQIHALGGRLYEGVEQGLRALHRHFPLFIVSNCQQGYIETFLSWSKLGPLFTDFECHGNTGSGKGENLSRIARRNGMSLPVYVGDTRSDREAAEEAGMRFIHARYGFGDAGGDCQGVDGFPQLTACLLE